MQKLSHKTCNLCGAKVYGILRPDRAAYRYPKRCPSCGKTRTKETVEKAKRTRLERAEFLPIGTKRLHKSREGLVYVEVKVGQPNEWKYEHRVVMATVLGRNLATSEHVHHRNENTQDNSPENLEVLSPAEHNRHHNLLSADQWSLNYSRCVICGTTQRRHLAKGMCTACYQSERKRLLP